MQIKNPFRPQPVPQMRMVKPKKENCKIKVKKIGNSRQIEFSGNCSREQIEVAKNNLNLEDEKSDN